MAVLGLTAASGIALAAGANSTRTTPAPVPARSTPAITPGCLADIECYGESELILNKPAASKAVPQVPAPEQDGPTSTPAD